MTESPIDQLLDQIARDEVVARNAEIERQLDEIPDLFWPFALRATPSLMGMDLDSPERHGQMIVPVVKERWDSIQELRALMGREPLELPDWMVLA